jgi:hypothetical protein
MRMTKGAITRKMLAPNQVDHFSVPKYLKLYSLFIFSVPTLDSYLKLERIGSEQSN